MKLPKFLRSVTALVSPTPAAAAKVAPQGPTSLFSPGVRLPNIDNTKRMDSLSKSFQLPFPVPKKGYGKGMAMDGKAMDNRLKLSLTAGSYGVSDLQLDFFAGQGFVGFQILAMLMQNWMIDKACTMPAKDAMRNGFEITANDGKSVPVEQLEQLRAVDKRMKLKDNLVECVRFGRGFGIRIVMFKVETSDPVTYYSAPFNPDGVTPGSYKGMSQIDPYWCAPLLDTSAASNPTALDFYEPTWWNIGGLLVHKSHLFIYIPNPVADVLKPSYLYAGVSIPQKIQERVYCFERTANEAPLLAMSKRMITMKMDTAQAIANEEDIATKMEKWSAMMNNFGIRVIGLKEDITQQDTGLADFDDTIMTQAQLVAAASNVPATKILGTTPKGFNSTGEYEESSYHEELETIQADITPMIERHHLLAIRSEVSPSKPFNVDAKWNPLDAPTAKELSETNLIKAQTGAALVGSGAIDGAEERERIVKDPESGYNGLSLNEVPEDPIDIDAEGAEGLKEGNPDNEPEGK